MKEKKIVGLKDGQRKRKETRCLDEWKVKGPRNKISVTKQWKSNHN